MAHLSGYPTPTPIEPHHVQDVKFVFEHQPSPSSSLSDQDCLWCCEDLNDLTFGKPPAPVLPTSMTYVASSAPRITSDAHEACLMIRNELRREHDLSPISTHLTRHPEITVEDRCMTVSWLCEVAMELQLQDETLFMAVTCLDRYLSIAEDVFRSTIQLVAVACASVAVKQHETDDVPAALWIDLAAHSFEVVDLARMEWLLLKNLDWRTYSPTTYTFLHLICHALSDSERLPALTVSVACYLAELSLLDYELLAYPYSRVASAALLLAHVITDESRTDAATAATATALCRIIPELGLESVCLVMSRLETLLCPVSCPADVYRLAGPIHKKYAKDEWWKASAAVAAYYGRKPADGDAWEEGAAEGGMMDGGGAGADLAAAAAAQSHQ